jgi:hypothetical protein
VQDLANRTESNSVFRGVLRVFWSTILGPGQSLVFPAFLSGYHEIVITWKVDIGGFLGRPEDGTLIQNSRHMFNIFLGQFTDAPRLQMTL